MSVALIGLPNSSASPSLAGSRPVSIFIVVVLPQPFDPRKPKISPRLIVKLTLSTAVKSPNRRVRPRATMTGSSSSAARGGIVKGLVAAAALFRQKRDEAFFQRRAIRSAP